jgi:predicted HTH domain antitoxin
MPQMEKGTIMESYTIELPRSAFSALRKEPSEFIREMKYAAAVKWYELGQISQSKGAEITGLSRYEFIALLNRYQVSAMQYTAEELAEELAGAR